MRVIVCGGRDFSDREVAYAALDRAHAKRRITAVIHGDYRGADRIARDWAISRGIEHMPYPADWKTFGAAAGPKRNTQMLTANPEGVIAFPGGSGTADMIAKAVVAGLPIWDPCKAHNLRLARS